MGDCSTGQALRFDRDDRENGATSFFRTQVSNCTSWGCKSAVTTGSFSTNFKRVAIPCGSQYRSLVSLSPPLGPGQVSAGSCRQASQHLPGSRQAEQPADAPPHHPVQQQCVAELCSSSPSQAGFVSDFRRGRRSGWGGRDRTPNGGIKIDYSMISRRIWKKRPKHGLAISTDWRSFPNEK